MKSSMIRPRGRRRRRLQTRPTGIRRRYHCLERCRRGVFSAGGVVVLSLNVPYQWHEPECWKQKMLIDMKEKRNEQTEQAELLMGGSTHDPQTQTHTVTAELGEGRDRDRPLPTCPENPTPEIGGHRVLRSDAPSATLSLFFFQSCTLLPSH
jgi:hypothetical protein